MVIKRILKPPKPVSARSLPLGPLLGRKPEPPPSKPPKHTKVINISKTDPHTMSSLRQNAEYVYIGRPSLYGNPFHIGVDGNRERVIRLYRQYLRKDKVLQGIIRSQLRNKILGCYCKPEACHGDVIIECLEGKNGF